MAILAVQTQTVHFDPSSGFSQIVHFDFGSAATIHQYLIGIAGFSFSAASSIQEIGMDNQAAQQGSSEIALNTTLIFKNSSSAMESFKASVDIVCLAFMKNSLDPPNLLMKQAATNLQNGASSSPTRNQFESGTYQQSNFLTGFNVQFPPPKTTLNQDINMISINVAAAKANYPADQFGLYSISTMQGANTNLYGLNQQTLTSGYGSLSGGFLVNNPAHTQSFMIVNNIAFGLDGQGLDSPNQLEVSLAHPVDMLKVNTVFLLQSFQFIMPWKNQLYQYKNQQFSLGTPQVKSMSNENKTAQIAFHPLLQLANESNPDETINAYCGASYLAISFPEKTVQS